MITFVSYSSKNFDLARALAVQIGVYGHDVQFEQKLAGGQVGWHEVFESIRVCDLFVLVVTLRSIDSYSCQLEYAYANALNKRILPVAIEDLDDALLRQHFGDSFIQWRLSPDQHSALERALEQMQLSEPPPPPAVLPLRPNWVNAMTTLRDAAITLPQGPRAQFSILDNLTEFLERDDSLPDALAIMRVLQTNPNLSPPTAQELTETLQQLDKARARQNSPRRASRLLRDLALIIAGAVLILVLARGAQFFNRPSGAAVTPTLAVTEEVREAATDELVEIAAVASISPATEEPILPPATAAPTNTPDAALTQGAVDLQNTATAAVGTALAVSAYTPTPLPSATPTRAPTLSFDQQLTALATSRTLEYVGLQVEDTDQGVRVTAVGNSAREVGIRIGDIVTAVDIETFNDRAGFLAVMNTRRAFTPVTFRLLRGNSTIYIRVNLALLDFGSPPPS